MSALVTAWACMRVLSSCFWEIFLWRGVARAGDRSRGFCLYRGSAFAGVGGLVLFLSLVLSINFTSTRSRVPSSDVHHTPSTGVGRFNNFLLSVKLVGMTPPGLPGFDLSIPGVDGSCGRLFHLGASTACSRKFSSTFSPSTFSNFKCKCN